MKVEITTYYALPCETEILKINDIDAEKCDFGGMDDGGVVEYECQNMKFVPDYSKESREAAMKKYGITCEEYLDVCEALKNKLNVGRCGWCV